MKILIVYWSGTGQTARAVREIAEILEEFGHETYLWRVRLSDNRKERGRCKSNGYSGGNDGIKDIYDSSVKDYFGTDPPVSPDGIDILGIGTPAYAYRAPRVFTRFLHKKVVPYYRRNPVRFFICVSSGGDPGNTEWSIYRLFGKGSTGRKAVKKYGRVPYLGSVNVYGVTNLRSWMPRDPYGRGASAGYDSGVLSADSARSFGRYLAGIMSDSDRDPGLFSEPPARSVGLSIFSVFLTYPWMMRTTVGRKYINTGQCTGCLLCATSICPTGAIVVRKEGSTTGGRGNKTRPPVKFRECKCTGCQGCVNLCPVGAIYSRVTRHHYRFDTFFGEICGKGRGRFDFRKI